MSRRLAINALVAADVEYVTRKCREVGVNPTALVELDASGKPVVTSVLTAGAAAMQLQSYSFLPVNGVEVMLYRGGSMASPGAVVVDFHCEDVDSVDFVRARFEEALPPGHWYLATNMCDSHVRFLDSIQVGSRVKETELTIPPAALVDGSGSSALNSPVFVAIYGY